MESILLMVQFARNLWISFFFGPLNFIPFFGFSQDLAGKGVWHYFSLAMCLPFLNFQIFNIVTTNFCQVLAKNSVSDIEKREKKVLEKKLGEMEDELKVSGVVIFEIIRGFSSRLTEESHLPKNKRTLTFRIMQLNILQQLQKLKSENEKLKSENRALTRVVSKLTSAASKAVPATPGPVNRK